MKTLHQYTRNQQQGTVLIISLIFLLILTLLGVSAMDGTLLESRLAANSEERNVALQVAEMGILANASSLDLATQDNVLIDGQTVSSVPRGNDRGLFAKTMITPQLRSLGTFNLLARSNNPSGQKTSWRYYEVQSIGQSAGDGQKPAFSTLSMGIRQQVMSN
ncbi:MAG: hypothetical protein KAI83_12725 [Thiomargarita sp.]|nr:hypothetical protein [Thiomargarita sp.]